MNARRAVAALAVAVLGAACGGDDDGDTASTTTPPSEQPTLAPDPLLIMVTNDDGYAAEGIDALVEALRQENLVEVSVVAPLDDRTGTGGQTTPGELVTSEVETASGYPAIAVDGFPADTVTAAVEQLDIEPDLVMSGINRGQNLGPVTDVSGTVGAAREAGRRGIPALAVSQGIPEPPDYPSGVEQALTWLEENRDDLEGVTNLNIPTCTEGELRGVVEVPLAGEEGAAQAGTPADCASTLTDPATDVEAFVNGYATLSPL